MLMYNQQPEVVEAMVPSRTMSTEEMFKRGCFVGINALARGVKTIARADGAVIAMDHRYQAMVNELAAEYDDDEETESEDEIAVAEARAPAEKRAKQVPTRNPVKLIDEDSDDEVAITAVSFPAAETVDDSAAMIESEKDDGGESDGSTTTVESDEDDGADGDGESEDDPMGAGANADVHINDFMPRRSCTKNVDYSFAGMARRRNHVTSGNEVMLNTVRSELADLRAKRAKWSRSRSTVDRAKYERRMIKYNHRELRLLNRLSDITAGLVDREREFTLY